MSCPKCHAPLEDHEISNGVVVRNCPACFGVLYGQETLAVPLKLTVKGPAGFPCPSCARAMETASAYEGRLEVDRCLSCGAIWFDAGELQILRKLSGVENLAGKPPADMSPDAAPPAEDASTAEPERPALAHIPALAPAKDDKDQTGKPPVPPEMENAKNPDGESAPTVELEGRRYAHFQTSVPVTTAVLGEFPWIAKVGDTARMRDFVSPPFLLSQEVTSKESVWSAGEYVEPEEIWTAFALEGAPPAKSGVAPAQPNPWSEELPAVWRFFWLAAAGCAALFVFLVMTASNKVVYDGGFNVAAADAERSRVGDVFEVKGRKSNLEIMLDTNLDGNWTSVSMALIDADTDQALDFSRDLSYYHGYEDGESWSEGSQRETIYVPGVPPGRYYLRLEPETDSPQLSIHVVARHDVPLARVPLIALALLLLPALWAGIRQNAFENQRWMESDHPRVSSSGGDDDDGDDE